MAIARDWLDRIQQTLFPPYCLLCRAAGAGGRDLCADCRAALPALGSACPLCSLPLMADTGPGPCGRCLRRPPPFRLTVAAFAYADPVDRLVQRLKFRGQLPVGRLLGELLADRLEAQISEPPDALLPVPLHPGRLRERGFNQAHELARPIARRFGLPLLPALARRVVATAAQSDLPLAERRRNLRGAFAIGRRHAPIQRVAIVDDVVTSGATVAELARALRRVGVASVEVWCVARTPEA